MKPISAWSLMEQGQYEQAYAQMTTEMAERPERALRHIYNRGLCLLQLDRRAEALADFQTLQRLRPDSDGGYIGAGIALWSLNQQIEAVETWKRGIGARYTDAAGGVVLAAILFFAASRLGEAILERQAVTLLRKKWRTKSATAWPGPIAGFLLGKLDERAFLESKKRSDPVWEKRRLTKVHFWIGLSWYRQGDIDRYKSYLQKTLSGHTLDEEYYLAKYELE